MSEHYLLSCARVSLTALAVLLALAAPVQAQTEPPPSTPAPVTPSVTPPVTTPAPAGDTAPAQEPEAEAAPTPIPTQLFTGKLVSATRRLPEKLAVFADCAGELARIHGVISNERYELALPQGVQCSVIVGEQDWEADVQDVFDVRTAVPLTMLVYLRAVREPEIAEELIDMGRQDNALRHAWAQHASAPAFIKRAEAEDRARQLRLRQIITTKGWPTFSKVGAQAANAAWLVAQHARPAQLKHWLVFMRAAAARHEIRLANVATTIDRVRVNEQRKQVYGTQYKRGNDGAITLYPIEDPANLDARRYSMGMSSHALYLDALKSQQPQ